METRSSLAVNEFPYSISEQSNNFHYLFLFLYMIDFDLAAIDGNNTKGGTKKFGSANFYRSHRRTPMDDLESLIYSLWHVSGISLGKKKYIGSSLAEGQIMKEKSPEEALARVQVSSTLVKAK